MEGENGLSTTIELKNRNYFNEWNIKSLKRKRDFYKKVSNSIIGKNTTAALCKIIEEFKPEHFIIENPATSKIFDYINYFHNLKGNKNKTYYGLYNSNFTLKPTIFYSDLKLELKTTKDKTTKWKKWGCFGDGADRTTYNLRSAIPTELIKEIFLQIWQKKT